jgi:CBS domain-containing protein
MEEATFEGVVEVCAVSRGQPIGREWMAAAVVSCPHQRAISGSTCLRCPRFVNVKPSSRDHGVARIRCLVVETDPVRDFMTPAVGLASVPPSAAIEAGHRTARDAGLHHLLVVDRGELVGVICRCELLPPIARDERIEDRMAADLWVVDDTATLGQAAAIMRATGVGLLPVVRDARVVGVLSRDDLLRAGAEIE